MRAARGGAQTKNMTRKNETKTFGWNFSLYNMRITSIKWMANGNERKRRRGNKRKIGTTRI